MGQLILGQLVLAQISATGGDRPLPEWTVKCGSTDTWTQIGVHETDTVQCNGDN